MEISLTSDLERISRKLRNNSPKAISRAAQSSVNRTAATLKTKARRAIAEEVQPRRGGQGAIGKLIFVTKARGGNLTASLDFSEKGVPVEATKKASVRKIRGKAGRYRVQVKGQSLIKAFKLGDSSKPLFIRSKGKIKRLYSFTLIQEARNAEVFDSLAREAPDIFMPQFLKLVDIFDGKDSVTGSDGRRR